MARSFNSRLTFMYMRAVLVVLLILAVGVAVSETVAFVQEVRSVQLEVRQRVTELMMSQIRAGRPLREAGMYALAQLGRPHFGVVVMSAGTSYSVAFNSFKPYGALNRFTGNVINDVTNAVLGFDVASTRVSVPGGFGYVQPDYYRLSEEIAATYLRLLPFALVAIALSYAFARNIAGRALRPVLDVTQELQEFAQGDFTPIRTKTNAPAEVRALDVAYNAAAAQAQKAVDDRELASENVRTFIADASHELKTPLTIIMGYIGAISEGVVTDRADENRVLRKTLSECRRMRGTIEKLISLARLDREPVNAAPFDVIALTREVTDSMKPLAPELHLEVGADGGAVTLGNANELREALVCIIDNAVKYASGSPIDVQVTKSADVAVIEIADAGPGMSAEDREHAFERFRRGTSHGDAGGSGLGLAIAKRAVERANGRIVLTSELGRGTTVRLYLPCVAANGIRDEQPSKETADQY